MLPDIVHAQERPQQQNAHRPVVLGSRSPAVTLYCIDHCKMLTSGHFQDQRQVQTKDLVVKRAHIQVWVLTI